MLKAFFSQHYCKVNWLWLSSYWDFGTKIYLFFGQLLNTSCLLYVCQIPEVKEEFYLAEFAQSYPHCPKKKSPHINFWSGHPIDKFFLFLRKGYPNYLSMPCASKLQKDLFKNLCRDLAESPIVIDSLDNCPLWMDSLCLNYVLYLVSSWLRCSFCRFIFLFFYFLFYFI